MLGEKRNLSLFGSQPAQEEKQVKHITVDRDGEKKDIPLYFGPDWPVVNGTGDTVPSPSDDPSSCQAEATAEKTEETVPVEPIPQDTPAGIADNSPDSDVQYPDDSPRRILASTTVVANRTHALFFAPEGDSRDFNSVLKEVQEYISGKYSSLITDGGDEDAKSQIKRYITKYVQDQRIAVKGYSADGLVDALYTEMAEFGLLTKYIFGTGIEEININSWRDIEVLYSNGQMVKLDEHFDSPGHAINVIRRMLHVSGMVLDNAALPSWATSARTFESLFSRLLWSMRMWASPPPSVLSTRRTCKRTTLSVAAPPLGTCWTSCPPACGTVFPFVWPEPPAAARPQWLDGC